MGLVTLSVFFLFFVFLGALCVMFPFVWIAIVGNGVFSFLFFVLFRVAAFTQCGGKGN